MSHSIRKHIKAILVIGNEVYLPFACHISVDFYFLHRHTWKKRHCAIKYLFNWKEYWL